MFAILALLAPVFALLFIGILVERFRLVPPGGAATLNMLVFNLAMPCLIFRSMAASDPADLARGAYVGGTLIGMLACYVLTHGLVSRGFRTRHNQASIMGVLASFPNTAFMGLPIMISLFPGNHDAVLASTISTVFCLPLLLVGMFGQEWCRNAGNLSRRRLLRNVARTMLHNPILLATLAGAVVCVGRVPVPEGVLAVCRSLAATATPCALVALGMVLSIQMTSSVIGESHLGWQLGADFIKLVVQPVVTLVALAWLGVSGKWLAMGVILSGMPTGSVAYVLSETYGVATRDASRVTLVDTALSVLTIPLMVFLLQRAGIMTGGGL